MPAGRLQYRNVGTSIECEGGLVAGGRYSLRISVEQSALAGADTAAADRPSFRTSMSQFTALVQDGQTAQVVSGTDPLTGEVTAVEVTLTVPK
jgi:hypothetical protein